jgi:hypothetical protein
MAIWQISNYYKKEAVERQFWTKDDLTIVKSEGFRWGTWQCESDEQPDIDLNNPDGYELLFTDYNWDMVMMDDGCWLEWDWPEGMPDEERERIEQLWEEDWFEGLESDGWSNDETEHWIYGPIKLVNMDTGEEYIGEV